jgi:hypothetical protein
VYCQSPMVWILFYWHSFSLFGVTDSAMVFTNGPYLLGAGCPVNHGPELEAF